MGKIVLALVSFEDGDFLHECFDSGLLTGKDAAKNEVRNQQENDQGKINEVARHVEPKRICKTGDPFRQDCSNQPDHGKEYPDQRILEQIPPLAHAIEHKDQKRDAQDQQHYAKRHIH